jgi:hypothetical protein
MYLNVTTGEWCRNRGSSFCIEGEAMSNDYQPTKQ